MIRDILDHEGNVIGQMELPDDTPEDQWIEKLAPYAKAPAEISTEEKVKARVRDAIAFGNDLIVQFAASNVLAGYTTEQIATMSSKLRDVQLLLQSGSLYTAIVALEALTPDELITREMIDSYVNKIKTYLGMPIGEE